MPSGSPFELTFVFPCLNEQATLGKCIQELRSSLDPSGVPYEIIVADNGSTDNSREIAQNAGARVVPVKERGYGAALKGGIEAADSTYVMFADADSTYMLEHAAELYRKAVENKADMAIASRMKGKIEDGAMPTLHRYLGTPVLTWLINRLFKGELSDCNSGFRCIRKSAYLQWDIRASGMEFASELLIKALKAKASVVEIPSGLRPGPPDRVAHLRTWRDGMRHLLFILSERPRLFEFSGAILLCLSTFLQLLAWMMGPTKIGPFNVFDVHSQTLLLLGGLAGAQFYLLSLYLYIHEREKPLALTRKLLNADEGVLFFGLLCTFLADTILVGFFVLLWALQHFQGLGLVRALVTMVHVLGLSGTLAIGLLGAHILKKSR